MARPALDPDGAAHQPGQVPGDGEAEPRPAVAPRRRGVDLRELFEQLRLALERDADPRVDHLEPPRRDRGVAGLRRLAAGADRDAPLARELERVAGEVEHDLPHPGRVADDRAGGVIGEIEPQGQAVALRRGPQQRDDRLQRAAQVERDRFDAQLAGLDLGEVEDVVDDRQERLGRATGDQQVGALPLRQRGVEHEIGHPDHAVQRRPDLVTHVGQESRAGLRRVAGRVALAAQLDRPLRHLVRQLRGVAREAAGPRADDHPERAEEGERAGDVERRGLVEVGLDGERDARSPRVPRSFAVGREDLEPVLAGAQVLVDRRALRAVLVPALVEPLEPVAEPHPAGNREIRHGEVDLHAAASGGERHPVPLEGLPVDGQAGDHGGRGEDARREPLRVDHGHALRGREPQPAVGGSGGRGLRPGLAVVAAQAVARVEDAHAPDRGRAVPGSRSPMVRPRRSRCGSRSRAGRRRPRRSAGPGRRAGRSRA